MRDLHEFWDSLLKLVDFRPRERKLRFHRPKPELLVPFKDRCKACPSRAALHEMAIYARELVFSIYQRASYRSRIFFFHNEARWVLFLGGRTPPSCVLTSTRKLVGNVGLDGRPSLRKLIVLFFPRSGFRRLSVNRIT